MCPCLRLRLFPRRSRRAGDTCEGADRGGEGGIAATEADRRGSIGEGEKHSPDLREIQDTLDYLDDTLDDIDRSAGGTVTVPNVEYKKWVNDGWQKVVSAVYQAEQGKKQARIGEELQNLGLRSVT